MLLIEEEYIDVLGQALFLRKYSKESNRDHPVMVFLHEGLGSIEFWKDFPLKMIEATGLNAIVYDRQGYGKSASQKLLRTDNYLQIEAFDYLPALLDVLKIKAPILIGHSDGASIALLHASKYKDSLVLAAAPHIYVEDVTLQGIQSATDSFNDVFLKKLEKYHGAKGESVFRAWSDTWLRESFRTWNISKELSRIECPCLILQGKNDEFATAGQFYEILALIGDKAEGCLLEDCGHSPHIQAKRKTFERMTAFVLNNLAKN